jgi:hypothetical protein
VQVKCVEMSYLGRMAPEAAHSPLCCQNGNVQEPPLPHMKNRV